MLQSTQVNEIFAALAAAQGKFEPIQKNKTVRVTMKSGGTYTFDYADLDEVLSKTRQALSTAGLAITQILGEQNLPGGTERIGLMTTLLVHSSGQFVGDILYYPLTGTVQDMGAAITYKRRYAIQAILGIAAEADDDGGRPDNMDKKEASSRTPAKRTPGVGPDAQAAQRDPLHPTDADAVEVDTIMKFKEAHDLTALTAIFNKLPAEWRRPGTKLYDAFKARRTELGAKD